MVSAARDTGLFGPGSVAWDLHSHPAMLVGGLRALMVQALHPLGMAAVADHSDYRSDVWGRFDRTSGYVLNTVYGERALAEELGARVRAVHRPIRGIDSVTGRAYSADDPVLLLWIHCTLIESFLSAYRRYVGPVAPERADAYVAEMVRQAQLVGLQAEDVPSDERANAAFIRDQIPDLVRTTRSLEAMDTFLHPPLTPLRRPYWWAATTAALAILPDYALNMYEMSRPQVGASMVQPFVQFGSRFIRSFLPGPPVLQQARRAAEAAGRPIS